jgi:hypothetical protein
MNFSKLEDEKGFARRQKQPGELRRRYNQAANAIIRTLSGSGTALGWPESFADRNPVGFF